MGRRTITTVILLSVLLVTATPFVLPVTVTTPEELRDLRLGAPVPFIRQESHLTPPSEAFPLRLNLLSPWEHPTRILWGNLIASVAIVAAALLGLARLIRRVTGPAPRR